LAEETQELFFKTIKEMCARCARVCEREREGEHTNLLQKALSETMTEGELKIEDKSDTE